MVEGSKSQTESNTRCDVLHELLERERQLLLAAKALENYARHIQRDRAQHSITCPVCMQVKGRAA